MKATQALLKFWPMIVSIGSVLVIVVGGVYAAGQDVEKFRGELGKAKEKIEEVQKAVIDSNEDTKASLASTDTEVSAIKAQATQDNAEIKKIAEQVKEAKQEIKHAKDEVVKLKTEISSLKTQQRADSDWIKRALQRIEAKQ